MFSSLMHLMLSLSISYPDLIKKFMTFGGQQPGGDDEASIKSNEGCNSGPNRA
jgi:hypothetical protein